MFFCAYWLANIAWVALVLWMLYDFFCYISYPKKIITNFQKRAYDALYPMMNNLLQAEWVNIQESDIDKSSLSFPLYDGIKDNVMQHIKSPFLRNKLNLSFPYCQMAVSSIFENLIEPQDHEDWVLLDYKIQHIEREIQFAFYEIKSKIKTMLIKDIMPELNKSLQEFDTKVEHLTKFIKRDKQWLSTSGFISTKASSSPLELKEAAQIIARCGMSFLEKARNIDVKSMATIAGNADKKDWDLFCNLIYALSQKNINYFYSIYEYSAEKENVPIEFLEYALDWLKSCNLTLSNSQREQIEDTLTKLKKDLGLTSSEDASQKNIDDILQNMKKIHLGSRIAALNYLECPPGALDDTIKQAILKKHSHLKSLLPNLEGKDEAKTTVRVEMAFLDQYVKPYLNV